MDTSQVVWRPSPEVIERSRLARLLKKLQVPSIEALQKRSIEEPEWFWPLVVDWAKTVSVLELAKEILVNVPPLGANCHCTVGTGTPAERAVSGAVIVRMAPQVRPRSYRAPGVLS